MGVGLTIRFERRYSKMGSGIFISYNFIQHSHDFIKKQKAYRKMFYRRWDIFAFNKYVVLVTKFLVLIGRSLANIPWRPPTNIELKFEIRGY